MIKMDLAPFLGGIWDPILFAFVLSPAVAITCLIWLQNYFSQNIKTSIQDTLQIWSRITLDSTIVMGICGTSIGIQGMIANGDPSGLNIEGTYSSFRLAMLTFAWAGVLAGIAFAIRDKEQIIQYRLNGLSVFIMVMLVISPLITFQCQSTGVPVRAFLFTSTSWLVYGGIFLSCFFMGSLKQGAKSKLIIAIESNLTATLCGAGLGICFWFIEGANYLNSRDAIVLTANIIFLGCVTYLMLHLFSLYLGQVERGNFQIKTWHFAEASSFFIFLVFAPVGATEFMRESLDQNTTQDQHEAQQLEINQLKAQIKLLTEKVGEV